MILWSKTFIGNCHGFMRHYVSNKRLSAAHNLLSFIKEEVAGGAKTSFKKNEVFRLFSSILPPIHRQQCSGMYDRF
jgi:hypothetical protein